MKETFVTFLLDETASMESIKAPTIDAFNEYLHGLKEDHFSADGGRYLFSLVKFNSYGVVTPYRSMTISNVPALSADSYRPGGMTPLIDACMEAIRATERALEVRRMSEATANVLCVFQTDGGENSSTRFLNSDLAARIKEKKARGWTFMFLGSGIDAYAPAAGMGIDHTHTVSYGHDAANTRAALDGLFVKTSAFARSGDSASMAYTQAEKEAVGDVYAGSQHYAARRKRTIGQVRL